MAKRWLFLLTLASAVAPAVVIAQATPGGPTPAEPSAVEVLRRVDAIISPPEFEAKMTFSSHKTNGEVRTYSLRLLKKGSDRFRVWFLSPADDVGQEVLRIGDDIWAYMPNLKRSLKISAKQEFHGGDFANSDVMRVDLLRDYAPAIIEVLPDQWVLELKAKNDEVTYARVKVWVRKKDFQPQHFEYYAGSGKLIRKMDLSELKTHGKLVLPTRYLMHNALEPKRQSEMRYDSVLFKKNIDAALFEQAALGR